MREIKVGIRIHLKEGITFFGIDEVNDFIRQGAQVVSLQPGGVIMQKMGEDAGHVRLTLSGCDLKVLLDEPPSP